MICLKWVSKYRKLGFWEPRFSKISGGASPQIPLVRAPPALSKIWGSTNTPIETLATRLRLLAITWRKTTYPINKREIPTRGILEVLAARHLCFSKVLAAHKENLTTARARKDIHAACMLAKTMTPHIQGALSRNCEVVRDGEG